jgi:hypothetical protein
MQSGYYFSRSKSFPLSLLQESLLLNWQSFIRVIATHWIQGPHSIDSFKAPSFLFPTSQVTLRGPRNEGISGISSESISTS